MKWLSQYSRLQWKLVLSYVLVTLATVAVLELTAIFAINQFGLSALGRIIGNSGMERARQLAGEASDPLKLASIEDLTALAEESSGLVFQFTTTNEDGETETITRSEVFAVVGLDGIVLASNSYTKFAPGTRLVGDTLSNPSRLLGQALEEGIEGGTLDTERQSYSAAVPVVDDSLNTIGAVYVEQPVPDPGSPLDSVWGPIVTWTMLLLLPFSILLGVGGGYLVASRFTRRLDRLAAAASSLAGGDLSRRVNDSSSDEIGQLAGQFNHMAERLETDTLELRTFAEENAELARKTQMLAGIEERHRLARELHDGVKQQLFALNLAATSAINLIDSDPDTARLRLREVVDLTRQAQGEMHSLLTELRPADLDSMSLPASLERYLTQWEGLHGISVEWTGEDQLQLPPAYEDALYRVAQEALANVARHSRASTVRVRLRTNEDTVELEVVDNGKGFDTDSVPGGSTGLRGIRERLEALGGNLDMTSSAEGGTRLVATLELRLASAGRSTRE
jgi:signal transduction histidine kinase